jgi:hypothetical protein
VTSVAFPGRPAEPPHGPFPGAEVLLKEAPFLPWRSLEADASARRYAAAEWRGVALLRVSYGEDRDGLLRWAFLTPRLEAAAIRVPRLHAVDFEEAVAYVERIEGSALSRLPLTEGWEAPLLRMAAQVASLSPWEGEPTLLALDGDRLRFELDFFLLHFYRGLLNRPADPGLQAGLRALAEEVASYPRTLAHRDFHTDNLLLSTAGEVVLLDYQDALLAPRCYDAASLAVDAYRRPDRRGEDRIERWVLEKLGASAEEFRRTALQRVLKALGTFGYQVTRRRKARYLAAARRSAVQARRLLESAPVALPGLGEALREAEGL